MIFFGDGYILHTPGLDDILARKPGGFVIGHAQEVHGRFGELHFYIVVTAALKIYLPGYILVFRIVAKVWQVNGDLYFGKIMQIVAVLGYLLAKEFIAPVSKILMKKQMPPDVEQQDGQQKYSSKLFQKHTGR